MFIQTFTSLSTQTPACHPGINVLTAEFDLPLDISELFPYINAERDDARMFDQPAHIRFTFLGRTFVLYSHKGMAVPFETLADAEDTIKQMIAYLNSLYEKKETIAPNNELYKPIPVIDILRVLPRTNCRVCGFATCMAFAVALSQGEVTSEQCPDLVETFRH